MIYNLLRPLLFLLPTEVAHAMSLRMLKLIPKFAFAATTDSVHQVMGLNFNNVVGLAAGFDKNGDYIDALAKLGFGFIEVGTITPHPQPGNPSPRLFRLPQHQALINRMGFDNKGVNHLIERLETCRYKGILGVNIGKNRETPITEALADYQQCFSKVYPYASYVTVNISSPNTPDLRDLQFGELFDELLAGLKKQQSELEDVFAKYVPLVIKLSPDLSDDEVGAVAAKLLTHHIDGVIATNTTLSRSGVETDKKAGQDGGLSGAPLTAQSTHIIQQLHHHLKGSMPIIAVGGIMNPADAAAKLAAGASLVQLYTGLVYGGPGMVPKIVRALTS